MSVTDRPHQPRLRALDALRGLAAVAVVFSHSIEQALYFMPVGVIKTLLLAAFIEYADLGRIGVVTFFLISGYVIPFSFQHHRPLPSFLVSRAFRLYPAYWLSLIAAVVVFFWIKGTAPSSRAILLNATMIPSALGAPNIIGAYWTLFYELLFYGFCIAAFAAGKMLSPKYLLMMVVALCAAAWAAASARFLHVTHAAPIGLPMFLAVMHLGTLARVKDYNTHASGNRCFQIALIVVLLTIGPVSGIGFIQRAPGERLIADITSLYIGLGLFFSLRHSSFIVSRFWLFMGLISYSLYLTHQIALDSIVYASKAIGGAAASAIIIFCVPIAAVVIAVASQRFVEAPANKWGRSARRKLLGSGLPGTPVLRGLATAATR